MKALLFAWVAQAADLASTIYGFQNGNVELNPVVGQSPSLAIDIKILACLTMLFIYVITYKSRMARIASSALVVGAIFTLAISIWNVSLVLGY